ncbi:MAG: hypothetical protein GXO77_01115 [Calditrichaeota bacterium]|nr:hypothetical protein [Calditrichota bacterium]
MRGDYRLFKRGLIFALVLLTLNSCSLRRMMVREFTPVLENGMSAFYEESDLEIAEKALASNLKLLEGLLKSDPQNERLRLLLAQGYAGYALAFAEDTDAARARLFYLRSRNYAQSVLLKNAKIAAQWKGSIESFKKALQKTDKGDVPALFWTGFPWAGYINLSFDNPGALLDLPRVEALMERVKQLDSTYFYGAVYLFFGSIYGQRPRLLGGNPEKAKQCFEQNFKITGGKFLLSYVYAAKYYAAKVLDEELFDEYLEKVMNTPLDVLPEARLLNQIAKQKAKRLLAEKEELF